MDDVLLNKAQIIERCIRRIRDVYQSASPNFHQDLNLQDIVILNLQRACEAVLDMAAHTVRIKKLGLPQTSRDFFDLLENGDVLPPDLARKMKSMVGFRNIAVHDYQNLKLEIVRSIIEKHLDDFLDFSSRLLKG